jgi:hypothetical protein
MVLPSKTHPPKVPAIRGPRSEPAHPRWPRCSLGWSEGWCVEPASGRPKRPANGRDLPRGIGDEGTMPGVTGAAIEADVPVPSPEQVDDGLR